MPEYARTTIDTLMGSPVPEEHWVHKTGGNIRQYRCYSRAEASELCALLNLTTAEQRIEAVRMACEEMEDAD
jgi:hypothetical protein